MMVRCMEKKTVKTTRAVLDDAKRLLEAAGPLPAMAGMQASQKASECEQSGDLQGAEHWGAVAALIVATGGDFDVEIVG